MEYILIEAENNLPNLELMTLSPISHYLNNQRCSLLSPSSSYTFFNKKKAWNFIPTLYYVYAKD